MQTKLDKPRLFLRLLLSDCLTERTELRVLRTSLTDPDLSEDRRASPVFCVGDFFRWSKYPAAHSIDHRIKQEGVGNDGTLLRLHSIGSLDVDKGRLTFKGCRRALSDINMFAKFEVGLRPLTILEHCQVDRMTLNFDLEPCNRTILPPTSKTVWLFVHRLRCISYGAWALYTSTFGLELASRVSLNCFALRVY